eukprot:jgi/Ulvmu1/11818/UM080_0029.1
MVVHAFMSYRTAPEVLLWNIYRNLLHTAPLTDFVVACSQIRRCLWTSLGATVRSGRPSIRKDSVSTSERGAAHSGPGMILNRSLCYLNGAVSSGTVLLPAGSCQTISQQNMFGCPVFFRCLCQLICVLGSENLVKDLAMHVASAEKKRKSGIMPDPIGYQLQPQQSI